MHPKWYITYTTTAWEFADIYTRGPRALGVYISKIPRSRGITIKYGISTISTTALMSMRSWYSTSSKFLMTNLSFVVDLHFTKLVVPNKHFAQLFFNTMWQPLHSIGLAM